ncbi:hypothetical protein MLD38_008198 [Melastoma candidum]|uniref:Uncharacterized protein n=1 Tax=Melastoma candidum TaxID=119954 RepID=A0ACB9RXV5_9MYRT|nr:hypothetical protein MLD38_008198 [Melastoma candidum]
MRKLQFPNGSLGRLQRYWLKGEKAGTSEVFAILPGFPDNVRTNEDGEFLGGDPCSAELLLSCFRTVPRIKEVHAEAPNIGDDALPASDRGEGYRASCTASSDLHYRDRPPSSLRRVWGRSPSSPSSFLRGHWEGWKDFWSERFSFLDNYGRFIRREKPLPSWSSADVDDFIASDPFHGPVLKAARDATQFGLYSKSLHGAGLSFAAGAVFGWTFGQEAASHWYQLYRLDTMQAQVKFLEWWKNKTEGSN